nr:PREDICTED: fasciclin-like arabinogalactan protein 3 isoform X2 [Musa acuminata subsp. malaccensis]
MASKPRALLSFLLLAFFLSSAAAFDVMEILGTYPDYSTFTKYLTDMKLVDVINSRQTVTVLVLDNTAIAPLSSLPADKLKSAISAHILLGYYDPYVLDGDLNKSALLPTLLGSSGAGLLKYTEMPDDQMVFGSAAPGAPHDSKVIKVVGARPYNLSVLQIDKAILPPGIGSAVPATSTPPAATPSKATAAPPTTTPATSVTPSPAPENNGSPVVPVAAPATGPSASAEAPKPITSTPVEAPKPATSAPVEAPQSSSSSPVEGPQLSASAPVEAPKPGTGAPVEAPKPSTGAPVEAPESSTGAPAEGPESSHRRTC